MRLHLVLGDTTVRRAEEIRGVKTLPRYTYHKKFFPDFPGYHGVRDRVKVRDEHTSSVWCWVVVAVLVQENREQDDVNVVDLLGHAFVIEEIDSIGGVLLHDVRARIRPRREHSKHVQSYLDFVHTQVRLGGDFREMAWLTARRRVGGYVCRHIGRKRLWLHGTRASQV